MPKDTSSEQSAILMPPREITYKTAFEILMGDEPPLDALGNIKKPDKLNLFQTALRNRIQETLAKEARNKEMADKTTANDDYGLKVVLFRQHGLKFPELNLRVCLTGPEWDCKGFPHLFSQAFCKGVTTPTEADIVVFTGGSDVDPSYYGEKKMDCVQIDEERDFQDISTYLTCVEAGIPMVGVCRGAQFLHVMNGGKLYQDVNNHNGNHGMYDSKKKFMLHKISSVHHQTCIYNNQMELVAKAWESTKRRFNDNHAQNGKLTDGDVEAFFYRDTCCFGVQGHPEYKGYNEFAKWFLDYIEELVVLNPDIEFDDNGLRRLKPEFIFERDARLKSTASKPQGSKKLLSLPPNPEVEAQPVVKGEN